jgi:hypothetical protein
LVLKIDKSENNIILPNLKRYYNICYNQEQYSKYSNKWQLCWDDEEFVDSLVGGATTKDIITTTYIFSTYFLMSNYFLHPHYDQEGVLGPKSTKHLVISQHRETSPFIKHYHFRIN